MVLHQARYELRAFLRNRQARFSTFVLPPLLLVVFVSGLGHDHDAASYIPGICSLAILVACFGNLAVSVTAQRETGVLKRRRATPVPAQVLIAGRALAATVAALAAVAIVCLLGAVMYGVTPGVSGAPAIALTAVVGSVTFASLGYALTTAIKSADAAHPVVQAIMLPLYVASGVFTPVRDLPVWLSDAGSALPLRHLADGLRHACRHGAPAWPDLGLLAIWAIAGAAVAIRRFTWTPATAGA